MSTLTSEQRMLSPIHFYFDFSSPYGYLAAMRINQLAQKYQREVEWHPILLGVVFKTTQCAPLTMVPLKGAYSAHDFVRTARFHSIPFSMPATFPTASQHAARATLWVKNQHGNASAAAFAQAIYQAYFVDGLPISELQQVLAIASQSGLDASVLADALTSQELRDQLKAEVDAAIKNAVFGSPFMLVDDEPFWGFDRFDQLETFLKNGQI